jgi:uncharacterized protein (TIGR02302 family)
MMKRKGISQNAASAPNKPAKSPEERLLERKVRAANRALLFEKLWPRVWLPLSISGVFVLLSAFEVWQLLPPRIHLGLLWGFGIAFVLSLLPLLFWRRPSRENSYARLEEASALDHRPLTAFNDTLSQEELAPETAALWGAHRARVAQSLSKLKSGTPNPRVDRYDPFALRAALVLMLVAVAAWASSDLAGRVRAAFTVPEIPVGADFRIDAWISPSPYTRKEPFVLANGSLSNGKDSVAVPQGSILTVKINGSGADRYRVALSGGQNEQALEPMGQSGETYAEYTQKVETSATLSIKRGFGTERTWALTVVPDRSPTIAFIGPVEVSQRAVMLFKYRVEDDYGVSNAEAHVERILPAPDRRGGTKEALPQIGKPPIFPLSLPHSPVKAADAKTYKDLTAHPWAGLPVVITLIAKDEAGHEGRSAPRGLILPERKFTKPLAKAVIDQRRSLVENPSDTSRIANNLNALAISAEDEGIAPTVYLSLRSAYWRLRGLPPIEEVESTVDQLWDVAVRIEDGNLSSAERDLRAAQERLKDAIENGASQEEIQKLMAELRQALNRYLQALAQQNAGRNDKAALSPNAKTISPQDLQQLLNKIESLAKAGSAEAAAQMLNELRDILESLQTAKRGDGDSEEDAQNLQQLDRLTDLMRQQQQLLDQTFRAQQGEEGAQSENGQRGQRSGRGQRQQGERGQGQAGGQPSAADLKRRQDDLRRQLQDLLSGMSPGKGRDAVQQKLQEAEEAMGDAGDALQQHELGEAGEQEGRALESMRQGTRAMAEQMMRSAGAGRGTSQANRDPLGRKQGSQLTDPGDSVKVPDEITVQRAREILDELRKRLGQPSRPPIELDYLERLVKPY